jgi:hypothetical protein
VVRPWQYIPSTPEERQAQKANLTNAEPYGPPRKVWVEDGHVFIEGHDGKTLSMTPEVAIELSRTLGEAGSESLVNKIMEQSLIETPTENMQPPPSD